MRRRPLIAVGALVLGGAVIASSGRPSRVGGLVRGALNARTLVDGGTAYRYQLFVPSDYDPATRWPVVVALHGSREKGEDGMRQTTVGVGPVVREQARTFPAVVVFPQVHTGESHQHSTEVLDRLISDAVGAVSADPRRIYLTGLSFGGIIAYDLVLANPRRFAAVVQVATHPIVLEPDGATRRPEAVVDAALARALHDTPVWLFHGAHDGAVPPERTRRLLEALRRGGVPVRYTEYADGDHGIWDRAYRSPELWSWLFAQRR